MCFVQLTLFLMAECFLLNDDAAKRPSPQALLFMGSHFLKHCSRMSLPLVRIKFLSGVKFRVHTINAINAINAIHAINAIDAKAFNFSKK